MYCDQTAKENIHCSLIFLLKLKFKSKCKKHVHDLDLDPFFSGLIPDPDLHLNYLDHKQGSKIDLNFTFVAVKHEDAPPPLLYFTLVFINGRDEGFMGGGMRSHF